MAQRVRFRARFNFACAYPIARVRQGFACGNDAQERQGEQKSSVHVVPLVAKGAVAVAEQALDGSGFVAEQAAQGRIVVAMLASN